MPTLSDILSSHKQSKRDKRVFGLVLQGGGMRGAYSAGALVRLIDYGFASNTFEHIVGSSAGAMNGAYFMASDTKAANIYTDKLTNKNFVNLLRTEKRVDIDYVVDDILKQQLPLSIKNLEDSYSELHIILTNALTGRKEIISDHKLFIEIYEELRATAALPVFYDKRVLVNNKWYIDGGVSDLLPIDVAHQLGCTDIVVIMTQQVRNYRFDSRHSRLANHIFRHFAANQPQPVRKILPTNEKLLKTNLHSITHPFKNTRIYLLEPSDEEMLITLATIDRPKVETFARLGASDMDTFLLKPLLG